MTVKFEGQDRRQATLDKVLPEYGFKSLEEARDLCLSKGIDVDAIVKGIQPIAFDNASWAYTLGCAIAIKKGIKNAADVAETIGLGLQAFAVPGSVGDTRKDVVGVALDIFIKSMSTVANTLASLFSTITLIH